MTDFLDLRNVVDLIQRGQPFGEVCHKLALYAPQVLRLPHSCAQNATLLSAPSHMLPDLSVPLISVSFLVLETQFAALLYASCFRSSEDTNL